MLSAGLAACGGGGTRSAGSGPAAASGLTGTELAARANGICAKGLTLHLPAKRLRGGAAVAAVYRAVASSIDRQTRELLALHPAAGPAADWRAFTTAAVAVDRLAHADQTAAAAGRVPRIGDPGRRSLVRRLVATATKVGATGCIKG